MKHLRDRNDILEYLEQAHDWGSVRIAIQHAANTEFLGFFSYISEVGEPGWLVEVTAGYCLHRLAVYYKRGELRNRKLFNPVGVPWEHWIGDHPNVLTGDNPERYKELRNEAQ